MKGSRRLFAETQTAGVPECKFLRDCYEMENVDNSWKKRMRIIKFDNKMLWDD